MWRADIYYRTDARLVDIMRDFDELVALRDLIGRGPNWYTRSGLSIRGGQIAECAPAHGNIFVRRPPALLALVRWMPQYHALAGCTRPRRAAHKP
jgi:hypothetical protein